MNQTNCKLIASMLFVGMTVLMIQAGTSAQNAKVDIRGDITKLTPANEAQKAQGILAVVLIEGKKLPETGYDKAYVKITKNAKLWKQKGMNKQQGSVMDLKVGVQVEALFTGPVAESYPVQATAGELIILLKE